MSDLLDAALHYADLGYSVFPCAPGTKDPVTEHGFKDATTNLDKIAEWWHFHPSANIAVATENLVVIDIDGRDNKWLSDQPERAIELAKAPLCTTPRGGRHYYFKQTAGCEVRCSTGRLAKGVDVRASGGYAVLPPSMRGSQAYTWVPGLELDCSPDKLPEVPAWLAEELARIGPQTPTAGDRATSARQANPIPTGQRNATLARQAGAMRRIGMSQGEIAAALLKANEDRCVPPLSVAEVERIAKSVARYEPDQKATALTEDHFGQMMAGDKPALVPVSLADLIARFPDLRPPVMHGLLRHGETMNVISAPKIGKSWLVTDLALAVATGRQWLDMFPTEPGDVLIIDNELHGETSANRIPKVAAARRIPLANIEKRVFVQNLRGQLLDIFTLGTYFQSLKAGRFKVIILDAFYRFMPIDTDENDNGRMASLYNRLDSYADRLGCCFVLIHHTSKGNQSGKSITDVGAGAGSQSRATDTHLVLRPHEQDDVVVLEAAVRSWAPVLPRCLRWAFPVWMPADELDPSQLRSERPKRTRKTEPEDDEQPPDELTWDAERFASSFVSGEPRTRDVILAEAKKAGLSERRAERYLREAEGLSLIHRQVGRNRFAVYVANTSSPPEERF